MALCQQQVLALSERLVAMDTESDIPEVDRNIEAFRDALVQRRALQAELADAKRELQEVERNMDALRESIMRAAAADETGSTGSLIYSSNSASSSRHGSLCSCGAVGP